MSWTAAPQESPRTRCNVCGIKLCLALRPPPPPVLGRLWTRRAMEGQLSQTGRSAGTRQRSRRITSEVSAIVVVNDSTEIKPLPEHSAVLMGLQPTSISGGLQLGPYRKTFQQKKKKRKEKIID